MSGPEVITRTPRDKVAALTRKIEAYLERTIIREGYRGELRITVSIGQSGGIRFAHAERKDQI